MEILTQNLPSGGYGYDFPSITLRPMTFMDIIGYIESAPTDKLSKYLFDIKWVTHDDPKINSCYIMDLDYLIFIKKMISVSKDTALSFSVKCPECGSNIDAKVNIKDVLFKAVDPAIMEGATVELNGSMYSIKPPTVKEFLDVFSKYLRYRKISDLDTIKLISLIKEFDNSPNKVERDVFGATHDDITALLLLKELYFDRVEPVKLYCQVCNKNKSREERRYVTVRINDLIVDFFREITRSNPITQDKIQFKQIRTS